jgi:DNA-binding NtrC family response regulator
VREVFAVAQQLRIRAAGAELLDLPLVADRIGPGTTPVGPAVPPTTPPADDTDGDDDGGPAPDRAGLEALLRAHRGVVSDVARAVRRSRKQVYRWIASHGIDVRRYRS